MCPLTGLPNTTPTPVTIRHSLASSDGPCLPAESTKQNGLYRTSEPLLNEKGMVLRTTCRALQETQASGKIQDPGKLPTEPQLATSTSQSPSSEMFLPASPPTCIPGSLPAEQQSPATTPPHSECICCKSVVCACMRGGPKGFPQKHVIMNSTYETACMWNECGNVTT